MQYLADQFWSWWVKEYLPNLKLRQRWFRHHDNVKKDEQLVGGTELEDSQKQRFHISRSFSSDTCQGIVRIKNVELRPLIKARERKEKSFLIGRKVSTNQKQKR